MKKRTKIILAILLVILLGAIGMACYILYPILFPPKPSGGGGSGGGTPIPPVFINYTNMEAVLSKYPLVQDMPESGTIVLRFYNFNSGFREWENSYILTKGKVEEGYTDKADIEIIVHSKYLDELTNRNLCSTLQKAQANGDFASETKISTVKLLWRYRGMKKYQDCLGM